MNAPATPTVIEFDGDASLGAILAAREPHGETALVIDYGSSEPDVADVRVCTRRGLHVAIIRVGTGIQRDTKRRFP